MTSIETRGNFDPIEKNAGLELPLRISVVGSALNGESIEPQVSPPILTENEKKVLYLASLGGTTASVAEELSYGVREIEQIRDILNGKFEVPTMAASVFQAIKTGLLPIEVKPLSKVRLSETQLTVLLLTAKGLSNREIAGSIGKVCGTFISNVQKPLYKKIAASGRTHSIRRAYELGIFDLQD